MKKIQILGTGCVKCMKLAENAEKAAKELGIEFEIQKVQDIKEIMNYGVMMTPPCHRWPGKGRGKGAVC